MSRVAAVIGLSSAVASALMVPQYMLCRVTHPTGVAATAASQIAMASQDAFDAKAFLDQLEEDISRQEQQLEECEGEEACMVEEELKLAEMVAKGDSLRARINAAKAHQNVKGVVAQLREDVSALKASLQVLAEQRRSAVAMLWDDRRIERSDEVGQDEFDV